MWMSLTVSRYKWSRKICYATYQHNSPKPCWNWIPITALISEAFVFKRRMYVLILFTAFRVGKEMVEHVLGMQEDSQFNPTIAN